MNLISIGGASRSGSTLLALLLGEKDGCFTVGELRYVWSRGYAENWLCGCGAPFRDCPFWRDVFTEAYGGFERVPVDEVAALHRSVAEIAHLPELLSPVKRPSFSRRVSTYVGHLDRLCSAIRSVSGADTIVDSSKLPSYCYLLSLLPGSTSRVLHLVRDSRAVAFSHMRKKRRPDVTWQEEYMVRFSPAKSAFDWAALNVSMEILRKRVPASELLRYEDFVAAADDNLARISSTLAQGPARIKETLTTNHTVSGNPIRMTDGKLTIREDTEWKERLERRDRRIVTGLTWPLLRRYGYVGNGRAARNAGRLDDDAEAAAVTSSSRAN